MTTTVKEIQYSEAEWASSMFVRAQSAPMWMNSAEHLRSAAEIVIRDIWAQPTSALVKIKSEPDVVRFRTQMLKRKPNYYPPLVLYGYALENVFKGLIVAREAKTIQPSRLSKKLQTHDLVKLAERAGIRLSDGETETMHTLHEMTVWVGRYPVPTKAEDMLLVRNDIGRIPMLLNVRKEVTVIRRVYRRAIKVLRDEYRTSEHMLLVRRARSRKSRR